MASVTMADVDDIRIGDTIRAVRIRKHLRQEDVARRARAQRRVVGRLENGALGRYPLDTIRAVAGALGIRVEVRVRWLGAELDRVLNEAHAGMHASVGSWLDSLGGWTWLPEVSFSIYGERGVIDILAWHAATRSLLIIELKSELADPQELVATMHRRVRLGHTIAASHGWEPESVSAWVIVRESSTDRRRLLRHTTLLRTAFPIEGRAMRAWMTRPNGAVSGLSFWSSVPVGGTRQATGPVRRVRRPAATAPTSDPSVAGHGGARQRTANGSGSAGGPG